MRLIELKQKIYRGWRTLHQVNDAYCPRSSCIQDEAFNRETRSYGDLRFKQTWEQAYSVIKAKLLFDSNDDNQFLIEFHLIRAPQNEGWKYLVNQVVEQFIAIPEGFDCLLNGFEQISRYGSG